VNQQLPRLFTYYLNASLIHVVCMMF